MKNKNKGLYKNTEKKYQLSASTLVSEKGELVVTGRLSYSPSSLPLSSLTGRLPTSLKSLVLSVDVERAKSFTL